MGAGEDSDKVGTDAPFVSVARVLVPVFPASSVCATVTVTEPVGEDVKSKATFHTLAMHVVVCEDSGVEIVTSSPFSVQAPPNGKIVSRVKSIVFVLGEVLFNKVKTGATVSFKKVRESPLTFPFASEMATVNVVLPSLAPEKSRDLLKWPEVHVVVSEAPPEKTIVAPLTLQVPETVNADLFAILI